jgi:hypothetical protein
MALCNGVAGAERCIPPPPADQAWARAVDQGLGGTVDRGSLPIDTITVTITATDDQLREAIANHAAELFLQRSFVLERLE